MFILSISTNIIQNTCSLHKLNYPISHWVRKFNNYRDLKIVYDYKNIINFINKIKTKKLHTNV